MTSARSQFLETPPPGESLFTGEQVYVHWAITNDSRWAVTEPFQVGIELDHELIITFPVSGLGSGETARELNIALLIDCGDRELILVVDTDGRVAESDETDNRYAVTSTWATLAPTPTPTATQSGSTQTTGVTFRWTYQPDGSRNLTSGVSTGVTTLNVEHGFIFSTQTVTGPSADFYYLDSSCTGCSGTSGPGFWANSGSAVSTTSARWTSTR